MVTAALAMVVGGDAAEKTDYETMNTSGNAGELEAIIVTAHVDTG